MKNRFAPPAVFNRNGCIAANKGGALMLTLVTVLFISLLIYSALNITVNSRRLTEHYLAYSGLYDMALAGNESAYAILTKSFKAHTLVAEEDQLAAADYRAAAVAGLRAANFIPGTAANISMQDVHLLSWTASVESGVSEFFNAETTVYFDKSKFYIETVVEKRVLDKEDNAIDVSRDVSYPATVRAEGGLPFDVYEPPVLKSSRR